MLPKSDAKASSGSSRWLRTTDTRCRLGLSVNWGAGRAQSDARLYGTYPEYLFSNSARGLYVDIYAPSAINFSFGGSDVAVEVFTDFPYGTSVLVQVASSPPAAFELALRMPEWVDAASVPVTVDGAPAGAGAPASYLKLQQTWGSPSAPTKVAFELPMRLRAHRYTGASQVAPYSHFLQFERTNFIELSMNSRQNADSEFNTYKVRLPKAMILAI